MSFSGMLANTQTSERSATDKELLGVSTTSPLVRFRAITRPSNGAAIGT